MKALGKEAISESAVRRGCKRFYNKDCSAADQRKSDQRSGRDRLYF